jgi:hypothetical protein
LLIVEQLSAWVGLLIVEQLSAWVRTADATVERSISGL